MKKYCKVWEAAKTLGVGAGTIRKLIKNGTIKGRKFGDSSNSPFFIEIESLTIK